MEERWCQFYFELEMQQNYFALYWNQEQSWLEEKSKDSHLVLGRLPLLQALRCLRDQRSLRLAAGNSGYCCFAVAVDCLCHTQSGCLEQLSCAVVGCCGPAPFDQSEVSEEDGPQRLRGIQGGTGLFSDCHDNSFVFFVLDEQNDTVHRVQLGDSQGERQQCGRRDTSGLLLRTFSRQLSSCLRQGGTSLYWLDPVSRCVLSHCCLLQVRLKALHSARGWPEGKDKSARHGCLFSTRSQLFIFRVLSPDGRLAQ